jgi:hypothetical protein
MPPLTCPPSSPPSEADCPLYSQRAITSDERLRRLVLAERRREVGLTALIRAEAAQQQDKQADPTASQPAGLLPRPTSLRFVFPKTQRGAKHG